MRADVAMFLFRQGVHRIFGKHLLVAMLIGLTSRGIDPETDSNAAQDDGLDLSATQLVAVPVLAQARRAPPGPGGATRGLLWSYQSPPRLVLAGSNVKDAITPPSYFSMNNTLYLVHSKTCLLSIASPFIQRGTGESDVRDKKERQIACCPLSETEDWVHAVLLRHVQERSRKTRSRSLPSRTGIRPDLA